MVMAGPVFVARGSPGAADYKRFYHAAAEKGFVASDPRAAKGAPSARGMTQLYRAMAETGASPTSWRSMKFEGGGPMAGMIYKVMGGAAFTHTLTAFSTTPCPPRTSRSRPITRSRTRSSLELSLADQLPTKDTVIAAELRPPRAELAASEAWTRGSTPTMPSGPYRRGVPCSSPTAPSGCRKKTTSGTSS